MVIDELIIQVRIYNAISKTLSSNESKIEINISAVKIVHVPK